MLALYRAGRQADALDAYRRARHTLVDELGLEPSRELQQLEAAILAQDPSLDAPRRAPPPRPRRRHRRSSPSPRHAAARPRRRTSRPRRRCSPTDVRILTITGPGGIGKTRFALELAHRLRDRFAEGAHFVALGRRRRPRPRRGRARADYRDRDRELLCRRQLRAGARRRAGAQPASPPPAHQGRGDQPRPAAARRRARARAPPARRRARHRAVPAPRPRRRPPRRARRSTTSSASARGSTACRWRSSSPPPAPRSSTAKEILDRLTKRLDLLSSGPRDAPARQQTLRAAIAWSYDLLDRGTKTLFASSASSAAASRSTAAEAVCGPQALDGIAALTDHSLLTRAAGRFTMLETVREYALEQLADERAVRDRHARAFAQQFADAETGMESPAMPDWLRRLDADRENLHAALRHANATGTPPPPSASSPRCGASGASAAPSRRRARSPRRDRPGRRAGAAGAGDQRHGRARRRGRRLRRRPRALHGRPGAGPGDRR